MTKNADFKNELESELNLVPLLYKHTAHKKERY